eukprot:SM000258S09092  [mRNA]  locus=s258:20591:24610:+ [translate_table: standard]
MTAAAAAAASWRWPRSSWSSGASSAPRTRIRASSPSPSRCALGGAVGVSLWTGLQAAASKDLCRLVLALNVLLLALAGALQRYLSDYQRDQRRRGYLQFYSRLRPLAQLPFIIFSAGDGALVLFVLLPGVRTSTISVAIHSTILIEVAAVLTVVVMYSRYVWLHRAYHSQPDAVGLLTSALRSAEQPASEGEIWELQEKQAVLLHLQQEQLRQLSLEEEAESAEVQAAQQHEISRLAAEKEQLAAELQVARALVVERDESLHQLRQVAKQHARESGRLRASLDEWSARAAKLELSIVSEKLVANDLRRRLTEEVEATKPPDDHMPGMCMSGSVKPTVRVLANSPSLRTLDE